MYKINYFFEYGGGGFLWGADDNTNNVLGIPINKNLLSITNETNAKLHAIEKEYQLSLNWDNPAGPSPWSDEHWIDFRKRAKQVYDILVIELGEEYEIDYKER